MAKELTGNLLVAQAEGTSAISNSTLAAVINEALNHECIEEVYGSINGLDGILTEDIIDLAAESQQTIRGLCYTPGSALGCTRRGLKRNEDYERLLNVLETHNIRFFAYIGGNEAIEAIQKISEKASARNYDLRTAVVLQNVENNLTVSDHCPGYASAIKYVATTIRELALDHESVGEYNLVSIVEIMEKSSGWITAGASLAKRANDTESAPHLIYLPEAPFSTEKFLEDIKAVLSKNPYCLIVVGQTLTDESANYIDLGSDKSIAQSLCALAQERLGVKTIYTALGATQRSAAHLASETDAKHATICGEKAVKAMVNGESDIIVTVMRGETEHYSCDATLAPIADNVNNGIKYFPKAWINEDNASVNFHFYKYANPLIQGEIHPKFENGLPSYVRLSYEFVDRLLSEYGQ